MDLDVKKYIDTIADSARKNDVTVLVDLIARITAEKPKLWGTSIISFGVYTYKYESGREGESPKIGLSSRKQAITLYGLHLSDSDHTNIRLLDKLGKHKTGKGCLYISKLTDIDLRILTQMIQNAAASTSTGE